VAVFHQHEHLEVVKTQGVGKGLIHRCWVPLPGGWLMGASSMALWLRLGMLRGKNREDGHGHI
jgi:hypothetical protein